MSSDTLVQSTQARRCDFLQRNALPKRNHVCESVPCGGNPEAQRRIEAAIKRGFQTRAGELDLDMMLGDLPNQ
jgi:hypothetical protein